MSGLSSNSRVVTWLGYLAITLLVALPLSVATVRSGAWQEGLLLYALACAGSSLLLLISLILVLIPRYRPFRGQILRRCLFSLPGVLLLFSIAGNRGDIPPIHDITTDVADPPVFEQALLLRGEGSNPIDLDAEEINLQLAAYPEVKTLRTDMAIEEAFEQAERLAIKMGWEVTRSDLNAGVIEAIDTTRIMGFKDDIVIRLRTDADGTLVDLRSVSRVGVSDLGANAARIQDFLERMRNVG